MSRITKIFVMLICFAMVAGLAAGCAAPAPQTSASSSAPAPAPASSSPAASSPAASESPSPSAKTGGELVIGATNDFSGGLQACKVQMGPDNAFFVYHNTGIWESLVKLGPDLTPAPSLATEWSNTPDGMEWTFKLRQGVSFTDGEPFNAEAVIANVNRYKNFANIDYYKAYANVAKVEAVDENTVKFTMSKPEPAFAAKICLYSGTIYSPKAIGSDGFITSPVGTGPLVFESYNKGESFKFTVNKKYWGGAPAFDKVTYKFILDGNTRVAALQSGEIDAIADVGGIMPEQIAALQQLPNIKIAEQLTDTSHYVIFNYKSGPFADVNMRTALYYALDRQELINTLVAGYGTIPEASVMAKTWNAGNAEPAFDMAKAKEYAAKVKVTKPVKIILCSGFDGRWPYKAYAEVIQSKLKDLGIQSNIEVYEFGKMSDSLTNLDFDVAISIHSNTNGDAGFFWDTLINNQDWLKSIFKTPEVAAKVNAAAEEMNADKRIADYKELDQMRIDQVLFIPLYHEISIIAYNTDKIDGLSIDSKYTIDFSKITIK